MIPHSAPRVGLPAEDTSMVSPVARQFPVQDKLGGIWWDDRALGMVLINKTMIDKGIQSFSYPVPVHPPIPQERPVRLVHVFSHLGCLRG